MKIHRMLGQDIVRILRSADAPMMIKEILVRLHEIKGYEATKKCDVMSFLEFDCGVRSVVVKDDQQRWSLRHREAIRADELMIKTDIAVPVPELLPLPEARNYIPTIGPPTRRDEIIRSTWQPTLSILPIVPVRV